MVMDIIEAPDRQTHLMQQTFRRALTALSEPLRPLVIPAIPAPPGIRSALWALVLTLLDRDVTVFWPGITATTQSNLMFHTGTRLTEMPEDADWLVLDVADPKAEQFLSRASIGCHERPDAAATILLLVSNDATEVLAQGPGFKDPTYLNLQLPESLVTRLIQNNHQYPLGVDCFLVTENSVSGLPRSTHLTMRTD